jgi:hypothetical protein
MDCGQEHLGQADTLDYGNEEHNQDEGEHPAGNFQQPARTSPPATFLIVENRLALFHLYIPS